MAAAEVQRLFTGSTPCRSPPCVQVVTVSRAQVLCCHTCPTTTNTQLPHMPPWP